MSLRHCHVLYVLCFSHVILHYANLDRLDKQILQVGIELVEVGAAVQRIETLIQLRRLLSELPPITDNTENI